MVEPDGFGEGLPADLRGRILRRARLSIGSAGADDPAGDPSAEAAAWLAAGSFAPLLAFAPSGGPPADRPSDRLGTRAATLAGLRPPDARRRTEGPRRRDRAGAAEAEDVADATPDASTEQPGAAAGSAILNAAFLPGWPPPPPPAPATAARTASRSAPPDAPPRLRSAGSLSALLARLALRLGAARRRLEALTGLGLLYASILAVMDAIAGERDQSADEEADRLRTIGLGGRERIQER